MSAQAEFRVLQLEQLYVQACEDRDCWRHHALRAEARLALLAAQERARQAADSEGLQ